MSCQRASAEQVGAKRPLTLEDEGRETERCLKFVLPSKKTPKAPINPKVSELTRTALVAPSNEVDMKIGDVALFAGIDIETHDYEEIGEPAAANEKVGGMGGLGTSYGRACGVHAAVHLQLACCLQKKKVSML